MCIDEWLTPFSGQVPGHRRGRWGCRLRRVTEVTAVVGWLSGPQRERERPEGHSGFSLETLILSEALPSSLPSVPLMGFPTCPSLAFPLIHLSRLSPHPQLHIKEESQKHNQGCNMSKRLGPSNPTGHFLFLPRQTFLCGLHQTAGSLPEHKGLLIKLLH